MLPLSLQPLLKNLLIYNGILIFLVIYGLERIEVLVQRYFLTLDYFDLELRIVFLIVIGIPFLCAVFSGLLFRGCPLS